jgi:hypothetical protein
MGGDGTASESEQRKIENKREKGWPHEVIF